MRGMEKWGGPLRDHGTEDCNREEPVGTGLLLFLRPSIDLMPLILTKRLCPHFIDETSEAQRG